MAATETAKPFDGSPIASALEFRKRNRVVPDFVDAAWGSTSLKVTAVGGTSINIANGRANIQGALYELTGGPLNLAVAANGGGSNRTDYAVLTYDSAHNPGVYSRVLTGTALTQNDTGVWDCPIASWQKTPAGAIQSLVDLRPFRGSTVQPCTSTTRPRNPTVGQVAYEADTDRLIRWDGSSWAVTWEDTGDVPLPVKFPSLWQAYAPFQIARRRNGMITVEVNLKRTGSTLNTDSSDDSGGSQLVTLPEGLRPPRQVYAPVVLTGGLVGRIRYQTDGGVFVQATSQDVAVGRFVRFCHTIPGD